MSLFGALFSGVSGLQSQSSAMGAIADNVTNVNTIGYKGTNVNFKTLVTAQVSLTQYSPGGVQSAPRQNIDIQGLLQATTSSTDVGISGAGFFVTSASSTTGDNSLFTYTRAGSFKVDNEGFLQNVGGGYMQGWPLSFYDGTASAKTVTVGNNTFMKAYIRENGDKVIINDNIIDPNNLRPMNLQTIGGTASPTTTMSVGANLPALANINHQERVNALIFDSLGNPHNISYNFVKREANQWSSTIEQPAQSAVITQKTQKGEVYYAGGRIDFNEEAQLPLSGRFLFEGHGANTFEITMDPADGATDDMDGGNIATANRTVSQVLDQVAATINHKMIEMYGGDPNDATNPAGRPPDPPGTWARRISGENGITFDNVSPTDALTFSIDTSDPANVPQDATGKSIVFQNRPGGYSIPPLDGGTFPDDAAYAWYDLEGVNLDPASDPNSPASYGTAHLGLAAITFAGNGVPAALFGRDPSESPSPKFNVEIVWANGAENMEAGNPSSPAIETFFGNYNTPDGITQMSGDFQLNYLQQNGAKFGNFAGVSIGSDGIVTALFDNGVTRPVFMIPLASFTNPNGLQSLSGNVWIATDFSGNPTLREAGTAGAGLINAATLEASTVDLGTEFTRMITTQRAYSSAAKIITTADDMLSELLNIKR
jgi:flagellar hook protein FlgE